MLFGGSTFATYFSDITTYTPRTDKWTREGKLLTARHSAGVISIENDAFIIIGGLMESSDRISSEKCDQLICTYQTPYPWEYCERICDYKRFQFETRKTFFIQIQNQLSVVGPWRFEALLILLQNVGRCLGRAGATRARFWCYCFLP